MTAEYIRLTKQEKFYSQKTLLTSQLSLLSALRNYHTYKKLRKEELMLKILLNKHIEETQQSINLLLSILPKVQKKELQIQIDPAKTEKKLSLTQEIELIRQKIKYLS